MAKSKGDKTSRWKRQWYVASKSGGKDHKVSEDHEGKFFCDCWPFRKNRICDHIREARAGGGRLSGEPELPEPTFDLCTESDILEHSCYYWQHETEWICPSNGDFLPHCFPLVQEWQDPGMPDGYRHDSSHRSVRPGV